MTRSQVAILLAKCAANDQRTVGESDVLAWHEVIGDVDFAEASEAVTRHYRESTDRIMPAHIRRLVRLIRDERRRLESHEIRALPSRFEGDSDRQVRVKQGVAHCRDVLGPIMARLNAARQAGNPELSKSDQIRERAIAQARAAKGGRAA